MSKRQRMLLVLAEWLSLTATPAFCAMAVWTGLIDVGPVAQLCSAAHASPIGGMATMYLLMGAIHTRPWLRLFAQRDYGAERLA